MANVDLVMRLLAEDRASDKFKKVGDSASVAHKRMDKFRKVAAGISATAITAFAVASVRAYADAEASQVKLEGAYKRFPKIADASIESLREMNSALQQTTTFDDDAVAGAQAMLAQFNLTGQQIKRVTPLLLDYAAATGQDVSSAATSLGKAFMGQTRALKAVGINYKTTGDAGKDFANITDLLSQKVGGFAEQEGKTAAGQLKILENQFGDLQETVGGALVPALTKLVDIAKPVVATIGALPAPVLASALAVGAVATAALIAVPKVLAFRAAMVEAGFAAKGLAFNLKTAGTAAVSMGALLFTEVGGAETRVFKPITRVTEAVKTQRDAVASVTTAFKKLQGILDKGAAKDAWVSALGDIGSKAKEAEGRLLGNGDAAITLRGQLRDSVGALQTYADGFQNPIKKAAVMRQGIARIRETLITSGIKPKDVDAFLKPLQQAAEEGYAKGKAVGTNIGLGVTRGIAASKADAIAEAEKLGRAAVQAVRRGASVESPSKYTMWVGEQIAAGLAVGAIKGGPAATKAVGDMARNAVGAADVAYSPSGRASSGGYALASPTAGGGGAARVNVYLDGKLVQTSLVDLKRTQGGRLNF